VIVLVLGGTRSGKSEVAERLAAEVADGGSVLYLATACTSEEDTEFIGRVNRHRSRRPPHWTTHEVDDPLTLPQLLADLDGPVLLDSLGSWVAAHPDLDPDLDGIVTALTGRSARGDVTLVVTEEVGLSVHPQTETGRRFADALGAANRLVADAADQVLFVVAGRTLELPTHGTHS
tara:strand:- start:461 stop:988 length:528 start_codon:yes stop_codon:yes gene_type:complete